MFPPVFALAESSSAVKALLGSNPLRVYAFGEAKQDVAKPYAVWQSGINPENYLGQIPDADFMPTQIDVYASSMGSARDAAQALRDVYQQYGYVTFQREWPREPDTNLYRYQIDVDFWQPR